MKKYKRIFSKAMDEYYRPTWGRPWWYLIPQTGREYDRLIKHAAREVRRAYGQQPHGVRHMIAKKIFSRLVSCPFQGEYGEQGGYGLPGGMVTADIDLALTIWAGDQWAMKALADIQRGTEHTYIR